MRLHNCWLTTLLMLTSTFCTADEGRKPIPEEKDREAALSLVEGLYKDQRTDATTSDEKRALAESLIEKSKGEPKAANQYALLAAAKNIAVLAGDAETAFKAIDSMALKFAVDAHKVKVDSLLEVASKTKLRAQRRHVAELSTQLIEECVQEDDFDAADQLYKAAVSSARRAREWKLAKEINIRQSEIEEVAKAFGGVEKDLEILKEKPADAEANLSVGRYYALIKGDWEAGLPMLAIGDDQIMQEFARKELAAPNKPAEQVALAEAWLAASDGKQGIALKNMRERSIHWLRKALPNASGLQADRITNHLAKLEPKEDSEEAGGQPVLRKIAQTFTFPNEAQLKKDWLIKGNWRIEQAGLRFLNQNTELTSIHKFHGDFSMRISYAMDRECELWLTLWGEMFVFPREGTGIATLIRKGNVVSFACNNDSPQILQLKDSQLSKTSPVLMHLDRRNLSRVRMNLVVHAIQINGTVVEDAKPTDEETKED